MTAPLERRARRLQLAAACNVAIVVLQAVTSAATRSLGLLADAGHNLVDVGAVLLALFALRLVGRRTTPARSFGLHRSTVLAAQANAAAVLAASLLIAYGAVRRLQHPVEIRALPVVVVACVAAATNLAAAAGLRHDRSDLNIRAAFLHLAGDAVASVGVAVAAGVMAFTGGLTWLDPAVALVIAALIAVEGVRLLRAAAEVLLEATPQGLDVEAVRGVMRSVPGVDDVHDLHAWSLSSEVRALSAHVVMSGHPTLEEAQTVAERVKHAIAQPFAIAHATLELECETCVTEGADPCAIDDLVTLPASHAAHAHHHR